MKLEFYKYHATGNDFIIIDDRKIGFDHKDHQLINKLCNRKFGIGADGLICIRDHPDYNFEMFYFNADGYQSSLCGNGGRCAVHFVNYLNIKTGQEFIFKAIDGKHTGLIDGELIYLKMNEITQIEKKTTLTDLPGKAYYLLNTGSPQYVTYIDGLTDFDVKHNGRKIRNNQHFRKEGINVNFVEKLSDNTIFVRSYERGVEDETLSCGTGVTAAALTYSIEEKSMMDNLKTKNAITNTVKIKTLGGELKVTFKSINNNFEDIYLIGPVKMVYKGEIQF